MSAATFTWDGQQIDTVGELFNGAVAAMRSGQAAEFFAAYSAVNAHAGENLGYVFGYADDATRRELYAAYRVVHPVFGGVV